MEIFEVSPGLFIWSALTFVLLVALLYKFAFGPLMELQQQRQDEIHESIREAERLREEARQLLSDYQEQLAKARHESEEILERARKMGESTRHEMLEEAKDQAERTLEKSREQIQRETREALRQIQKEVDITLAAAEKVTKKSLSDEEHLHLIKEAIEEVDLGAVAEK